MAIGAIRALQDLGKRVPEDVAVVGFDNILMGTMMKPSLTSIEQPVRQVGALATEKLLDVINGRKVKEKQTVIPSRLVIRDSSIILK
jgi:DNA-binding LacI/PurR family transcriptional regulator